MARRKTLTINRDGIERLATSDDIAAVIAKAAGLIAEDARRTAPRDSFGRHGADSIRYEMFDDARGQPVAHVSWGRRFGYWMQFREFGTSKTPARPFLRPAAVKRRSL